MGFFEILRGLLGLAGSKPRLTPRQQQQWNAKLAKSQEQLLAKVRRYEEKIRRNPIEGLQLRYAENSGWSSTPQVIKAGIYTVEIGLGLTTVQSTSDNAYCPRHHRIGAISITPFSNMYSPWATFVPFKIENHADKPVRLSLVSSQNPKISLVTRENGKYYAPTITDLVGEVFPRRPRIGILAFPPLRTPTKIIELHLSEGILSRKKDLTSVRFVYSCDTLPGIINRANEMPTLVQAVVKQFSNCEWR